MLEKQRKQGASVFLYLIFGLLIAIFVININPGSGKGDGGGGCSTGGTTYVTIDGNRVGQSAWYVAHNNSFIGDFMGSWGMRSSEERKFAAIELLIRRELLANAADERGMRVTSDMVMEEIKKGNIFIGGRRLNLGQQIFDHHDDGTKTWNRGKFDQVIGGMRVSKNSFIEEQTRGMQAALMQDLLMSSVRVSKEEAKDAFIEQKKTVSYDLVRFDPAAYRAGMKLTDTDIARYLAAHEDDVKARFKADERTYKDVKPQVKLRQVFIAKLDEPKPEDKKDEPKKDDAKKDDAKKDDKKPDVAKKDEPKKDEPKKDEPKKDDKKDEPKKPAGMTIDAAKARLETEKAAIAANRKQFAAVAAELSTDETTKHNGGDLGWRTVDSLGFPDKAINDAVKPLKPGEMTIVPTDKGVYLIKVDDKRPVGDAKDLTYDQVKMEIAAQLARDEWSKEGAKRAALKALADARAGTGKNLADLFQESADDRLRRQIEESTRGMRGPGGAVPPPIDFETQDEPMAWKPGDDAGSSGSSAPTGSAKGSGGSAAAGSAKGSAAGSGSATGSAAGGGSATGSAGTGSGSGAPTPQPTTPPKTPEAPALEPTKDRLPEFDVKPSLKKFGPFSRTVLSQLTKLAKQSRDYSRVGIDAEQIPVVLDELASGMLAKQVYLIDGVYVVLQVTAKGEPSMDEFEKESKSLMARMRLMRAAFLVEDWLRSRCEALAKEEKIKPTDGLFGRDEEDPKKPTEHYQPCMTFRRQAALGQQ